ncbi:sigma-54-dependent transcriptional regulator [Algisphaera agarilytica]|nr:sigma-54 dependent transcriptional regulator [Algisphaera agarilytica]
MANPSNAYVLVVDDDADFLRVSQWMLEQAGYSVLTATDHDQAIGRILEHEPDVILLDRHLGEEDGLNLIAPLQARVPEAAIILMTAQSTTELAVQAIKVGAFDFIVKPLDEARLMTVLQHAIERGDLLEKLGPAPDDELGFEGIIGQSTAMRAVFGAIENVAPTSVNVMVRGESGTGKELVAAAIHSRGAKPEGPFVPINMATLPAELVESTLFGHEKGSFTGAEKQRIGACEEAQGGTLFLDEITEMPIELQPKLLRFLQEKCFRRVGGSKDIPSDARIVSASNRNPLEAIKQGKLREDLYYRLNVIPVELPPLRERGNDIVLLAEHWLSEFSARYSKEFRTLSAEVTQSLVSHPWPGNVRQLQNTIERIVVLCNGIEVSEDMLNRELESVDVPTVEQKNLPTDDQAQQATPSNLPSRDKPSLFSDDQIYPLADLEKWAIEHALKLCDGSPAKACRQLGISPATIYRKIKRYEIS